MKQVYNPFEWSFKEFPSEYNMEEWFGDDHSESPPTPLTKKELAELGIYRINSDVLKDAQDSLDAKLLLELNAFLFRFPISVDRDEVLKRAKKVRGKPIIKIAVAFYSLGMDAEVLCNYLREKGIAITANDLYSLTYRAGLKKVRKDVSFEDAIKQHTQTLYELRELGLVAKAKELYEINYEKLKNPSRKPSTVAREALKLAVETLGVRLK